MMGSVEVEIGRRSEKAVARGLRKLDPEEDDFRCDKAMSTDGVFLCLGEERFEFERQWRSLVRVKTTRGIVGFGCWRLERSFVIFS